MRKKIRKISTISLCLLMVAVVFVVVPMNIGAEEEPPEEPPEEPEIPEELGLEGEGEWWVEGNGTYFEITNSTYLNITLTSSENVYIYLVSIPNVVSYHIEANCSATTTDITLTGFEASKTYYRYQDGYLQEEYTTDESGSYSYTQDISTHHHVYTQEDTSTLYISSDYTFTEDIYDSIVVTADDITIDGDGYTLQGPGTNYGIYLNSRSGITIKNVVVKDFSTNIYLSMFCDDNNISGNTVSGSSSSGIGLYRSYGNTISETTVSGNRIGISLYRTSSNVISGNTISGSSSSGISLDGSDTTISGNTISDNRIGISLYGSGNTISGNTISGNSKRGISQDRWSSCTISGNTILDNGGYGIYLSYSMGTISGNTISGSSSDAICLYRSGSTTISGNTITGNNKGITMSQSRSVTISGNTVSDSSWYGIHLSSFDSTTIHGNTISGSYYCGIYLQASSGNTISNNTISENAMSGSSFYGGIVLGSSSSNTVVWNTVSGNSDRGISLSGSSSNIINRNTVSGNNQGIRLYSSNDNTIFHNNFIDNTNQLYNYQSTNAWKTWENERWEGNFWSDYDGVDTDIPPDGIGDTELPHLEVDWYPLMAPWSENTAPTISSFTATPSMEGTPVEFTVIASDVDEDPLTYSFDFESDGIFDVTGPDNTATFTWYDDHTGTATVQVSDGTEIVEATTDVSVSNAPPEVIITGPAPGSLYQVDTWVSFTGAFTDPGLEDTQTATWELDSIMIPGEIVYSDSGGSVSGSYLVTQAGVYNLRLTLIDDDGGEDTADSVGDLTALIVVYDPEGGFVTGGGWINSPEGAYKPNPSLQGKASFGFVAKYKKGIQVPTGQTEFQFKVADLNFHSTSYDWLVVAGARAQFKGTGTINGEGSYKFKLWATDGVLLEGGDTDSFRIKIWEEDEQGNETVTYDNGMETPLGGGSIVIHTG